MSDRFAAAHMCRDGHVMIRHNDDADDELCPLCRALYALEWIGDQDPQLVDAARVKFRIHTILTPSPSEVERS
jgi:hypothetical protein